MSEKEILQKLINRFSNIKDFTIASELPARYGNIHVDSVIYYDGFPIACAEIKQHIVGDRKRLENDLKEQLRTMQKNTGPIEFFFSIVNDDFYYYNTQTEKLECKSDKEVFELLLMYVEKNADFCDELINPFKKTFDNCKESAEYYDILKEQLSEGNLLRYGDTVFLKKEAEFRFMHRLLMNCSSTNMSKMCRYTSAKSFYLSLANKFRINSVEAMNDQLETKVINKYSNLSYTNTKEESKKELADYVYNGFIISLSDICRRDKLSNWYMYGDKAKGVCFVAEVKDQCFWCKEESDSGESEDSFFCAPVVYISSDHKITNNPLPFLNELMGSAVTKEYKFKLRFMHFWKYFFKYDFYDEEKEIRLLYIKLNDNKIKSDWSEEYQTPFYYIEKAKYQLPFKITEVVLGPKLESREDYKCFVEEKLGCGVSNSVIVGYR